MSTLWRLHIKPGTEEGIDETQKRKEIFQHCLKKEIAAIGWPVKTKPKDPDDPDEYDRLATEQYKKTTNGIKKAAPAIRFAKEVKKGDLIWTRSPEEIYYLGKVMGNWHYNTERKFDEDLSGQRSCKWEKIGFEDRVPGAIINSFIRGSTFQRICPDGSDSAIKFSSQVYKNPRIFDEVKRSSPNLSQADMGEFFNLIDNQDCEDVAAIYLQHKDYYIIPTSCKKNTPNYEFILIHKTTGANAAIQVKQGAEVPEIEDEVLKEFKEFFIFSTQGDTETLEKRKAESTKIKILTPKEVFNFCKENSQRLPEKILIWLKFSSPRSQK